MKNIYLLFYFLFGLISFTYSQEIYLNPTIKKNKINTTIIDALDRLLLDYQNNKNVLWEPNDLKKWNNQPLETNLVLLLNYPNIIKKTLLGIINIDNSGTYIIKFGLSMNVDSINNTIPTVYNIIAKYNKDTNAILFSRYTDYYVKDWTRVKIGEINYYKEDRKKFNKREAKEQIIFNKKMADFFNAEVKKITYYSCKNPFELFNLMGYDFTFEMFLSSTGGLAAKGEKDTEFENIIYSGNNKEVYKHELVHFYINDLKVKNSTRLAEEGIATFLGGSSEFSFEEYLKEMNKYVTKKKIIDVLLFDEIKYTNKISSIYGFGALIAKIIYDKKGMNGLKMYLNEPKSSMLHYLSKEFGISEDDLLKYLTKELSRYE